MTPDTRSVGEPLALPVCCGFLPTYFEGHIVLSYGAKFKAGVVRDTENYFKRLKKIPFFMAQF